MTLTTERTRIIGSKSSLPKDSILPYNSTQLNSILDLTNYISDEEGGCPEKKPCLVVATPEELQRKRSRVLL